MADRKLTETDAVSAYPKEVLNREYGRSARSHMTSVRAVIVETLSVNMTFAEMSALIDTFGRDYELLSQFERDLQQEFALEVQERMMTR